MIRTSALLLLGAMLCLPAATTPGRAQDRQVPASRAAVQMSFAPIAAKVIPAVVNIYATRAVQARSRGVFDDPFLRQFFGDSQPRTERVQRSLGSGVLVAADGVVVTNNHVIETMTDVKVSLADKREFEADILLKDSRSDLAVLRLKAPGVRFAVIDIADSDALLVGDLVLAIGNPFGVGQTVTSGIVSAVARSQVGVSDFQSFIQTDAAINPGNSGGALVDMNRRLVGINTAIFSRSGGSIGIGFAIPSNMLKVVIASALEGQAVVRRPWVGARMQSVTSELAEPLGLERPAGVLVNDVGAGSPAERAGIKAGDVIVQVDGVPLDDADAFAYRLATRPLGTVITLALFRDGKVLPSRLKLEAAPEVPARGELDVSGRSPLSGAKLANLSPAVSEELALAEPADTGVAVLDVPADSSASDVGFRRGDVLVAINDVEVNSTDEAARMLAKRPRYWQIVIRRGGSVLTTELPG